MDQNGFPDATDDPMYNWMIQKLASQGGQTQQSGGQNGNQTASIMKMFTKGNQQPGQNPDGSFSSGSNDAGGFYDMNSSSGFGGGF